MQRTHVFCFELLFWSIQRFAPSRALLLAMGICKRTLERESDDACGICNEPLDDGLVDTADAKVYDSCSHKFHRLCMDTYIDARGVSEDQVQCPQCEIGQASLEITKRWLRITSPKSDAAKPMQPADAVEGCAAQSAPALLGPPTPKAESSSPLVPVMEELRHLSDKCEQMVLCNLCGAKVELAKTIVRGKQAGTFRCKACHSKCEIMRRRCGGFPPPVFAKMTEEQKKDFFIKTRSCAISLQSELQRIITGFKRTEKEWSVGGDFRPLAYWKKLGYDEELIKANSDKDDIRECRVAGTVYRVPVMSHGERSSEGTQEVDQQRISQKPTGRLQLKRGKWVVDGSDEDASSSEESSTAHGDSKAALAKAKRKAARLKEKAKRKAAKKSAQAKFDLAKAQRDAKANEQRDALKLKQQEAKLKLQVKASEAAFKAQNKAEDSRKRIATEGSSLLDKAIKAHTTTDAKARLSGICPHAMAALTRNLEEVKAAKEACRDVISDPGLTDKLPGDGDLKSIKAIIAKAGRTAAYVNSLCNPLSKGG